MDVAIQISENKVNYSKQIIVQLIIYVEEIIPDSFLK